MKQLGERPGPDGRYIVAPVRKALDVLQIVCEARAPQSLNAVALTAGLPKTTAFRYLHTLAAAGLVVETADGYRAGIGLWRLARHAGLQDAIRDLCLGEMRALQQRFNETVNLGILEGGEVLYLEMAESDHSLRMQARPGSTDPAHSTALGKALLAFTPAVRWRTALPDPLPRRTARTIADRRGLEAQLDAVRARGVALDIGENEEGSFCIAAPVCDGEGEAVAAISVSAPEHRMTETISHEVEAALRAAAARIAARLGGCPS